MEVIRRKEPVLCISTKYREWEKKGEREGRKGREKEEKGERRKKGEREGMRK